jgi:Uma2 family endonuclease
MSAATAEPETRIVYPESDGEPMAETQVHLEAMVLLRQALEDFYGDRRDVFISTDQFWFWNEGHPEDRLAPDLLVALGVPEKTKAERGSFRAWEENNVVPSIIFEMASEGTWRNDVKTKYEKYAELGVREYFIFDPLHEFLAKRLTGYRLSGSTYVPIIPDDFDVYSSLLGFKLTPEGEMIRLIDSATGRLIPTRRERIEQLGEEAVDLRETAEAEKLRAEAEKQRAEAAEAKLAKLQALLAQHNIPNGTGS